MGAPRIAGQDPAYLERQLLNFKSGKRAYHPDDKAGALMRSAVAGLDESQIRSLAEGYGRMVVAVAPAKAEKTASRESLAAGKSLYVATCSSCHGLQAQGYPQLRAPNLKILGDWYISSQIEGFIKGWRGGAEQSDQPAVWMRSIATHINNQKDLSDVTQYLTSLPDSATR